MNKLPLMALALLALNAKADNIVVDLGPPKIYKGPSPEARFPFDPPVTTINGQHLELDFTFANNEFILTTPSGSGLGFEIAPSLTLSGLASHPFLPAFTAYTVGADGMRNSPIQSSPGTGLEITDHFLLGFVFPFFERPGSPNSLGIYGLHLETTLPVSDDFTVVGGSLFLGGAGSAPFIVGKVPDTGVTLPMFASTLGVLLGFFKLQRRGARA